MKTKRTKSKLQRQTLARLVSTLPPPLALQAAKHGRTLTPIEAAATDYLDVLGWCKKSRSSKDKLASEAFGQGAVKKWNALSFEIMCAVQDGDHAAIRDLAKIVETKQTQSEDKTRSTLLSMKVHGYKFTVEKVAEWLRYPEGTDLSRLRKTAKSIGYNFAKSQVGRPRKTQDK